MEELRFFEMAKNCATSLANRIPSRALLGAEERL